MANFKTSYEARHDYLFSDQATFSSVVFPTSAGKISTDSIDGTSGRIVSVPAAIAESVVITAPMEPVVGNIYGTASNGSITIFSTEAADTNKTVAYFVTR